MRYGRRAAVLLVILLACSSHGLGMHETGPEIAKYIYPDARVKISLIEAEGREGRLLLGKPMAVDSPLAKKIVAELRMPFHESVIKLNQCSRNLAGDDEGPNVLFLSRNEGGFPRQGLAIRETDSEAVVRYPKLNYVDLVLNEQRVDMGMMDIFSHELGHVMMMNVWPEFPQGRSSKQHVSMGVTDYATAFFEGWGIHFQRLAYERVEKYRVSFDDSFHYSRATGGLWHSNLDKELRLNAVLQNKYIYKKLLPGLDTSTMSMAELILLEHTSPHFDMTRLKNAQQMLSCEGVLATLFYRISSNPTLQNGYRTKDFYSRFLISELPGGIAIQDVFSPFENVMLKNFWVWHELKGRLSEDDVIAVEFIKQWGRSFPEDREEILKVFLMTTVGMTVSPKLAVPFEQMAYYGMIGDMTSFREYFPQYQAAFKTIFNEVLGGEVELDSNVGPQLWLRNGDFLLPSTLWNPDSRVPLMVNLNTASEFDLASFKGITRDAAVEIIRKRDRIGYFPNLDAAVEAGFQRQ